MRTQNTYILTVGLCLFSLGIYAQDIVNPKADTIKWSYGRIENKKRSEKIALNGHLISYGENGFVWVQNRTERKYFFEINSVKGDWNDTSPNGELVFESVCQGIAGTIRIYKVRREVKIQIDFTQPNKLTPNIILEIASFQKI